MNKVFISIILLIAFSCFSGCSGHISKFIVPSAANEPNIKQGATILVSTSRQPQRFEFICFNNELEGMGNFVEVFRMCGLENDVVEIKNGDLFVNGKMVDNRFNLLQLYAMPLAEFEKIAALINSNEAVPNERKDSMQLYLSTEFVREQKLVASRVILPKNQKDDDIMKVFHQKWNPDHFGPVLVPKDHYFVLGDNRRQAADSRYLGFITKDKWVGTVILK